MDLGAAGAGEVAADDRCALMMTDDELSVEMVPLVLVTVVLEMFSVPPPVASSVPVFVVGTY